MFPDGLLAFPSSVTRKVNWWLVRFSKSRWPLKISLALVVVILKFVATANGKTEMNFVTHRLIVTSNFTGRALKRKLRKWCQMHIFRGKANGFKHQEPENIDIIPGEGKHHHADRGNLQDQSKVPLTACSSGRKTSVHTWVGCTIRRLIRAIRTQQYSSPSNSNEGSFWSGGTEGTGWVSSRTSNMPAHCLVTSQQRMVQRRKRRQLQTPERLRPRANFHWHRRCSPAVPRCPPVGWIACRLTAAAARSRSKTGRRKTRPSGTLHRPLHKYLDK